MTSNRNGACKIYRMPAATYGAFASSIVKPAGPPAQIGRTPDTLHSMAAGRPGALEGWYAGVTDGYRPALGARDAAMAMRARLDAYAKARLG